MTKLNLGHDLYLKGRIGWRGLNKDEYLERSDYKIINATALMDGYVDWDNCGYITKERYEESEEIMLREGDLLISKDGTLGKIGYVKNISSPTTVASGVFVLRNSIPDILDFDYLYHVLKSPIFKGFIARNKSLGSTIPHLYQRDLEQFELELPPKKEQTRIAKILNSIDNAIANNNTIISNLEKMAELLYSYWFIQFDFPDKNGAPYKSSGGKMVYNEVIKHEIPEGWSVKPLVQCVSKEKNAIVDGPFGTQMKISDYVNKGVPIYEMEQLNGAFIVKENSHFITEEKYNDVKRSMVKNGDIIISKTGTLGLLGIVKSQYEKGIIVSRLAKITPDPNVIGKYALMIYLNMLTKSGYWLNICGGSTMPILNNGTIGDTKVLVPNTELYQTFEDIANPIYERVFDAQLQNQKLNSLRDLLLPMLISGQIAIKD